MDISATAFLCCESKARRESLSRDCFAKLWTNTETAAQWEAFAQAACRYDDIELSLRNRFFLERMEQFSRECAAARKNQHAAAKEKPIVVNIASGFTSYPYLIDQLEIPCVFFEIDYAHILEFKQAQLGSFEAEGALPSLHSVELHYVPMDLCSEEALDLLRAQLGTALGQGPSFVLLEGISYYLPLARLIQLLDFFYEHQLEESQLGIEYWHTSIVEYPAFQRLKTHFASGYGQKSTEYTLIDESSVFKRQGYQILEDTSIAAQEEVYCTSSVLQDDSAILPASLCLLQKYACGQ